MNGFERRKKQKMDAILEAALSLFLERGIKDTSVAEIAKAANVSQVTIYNYYTSKENVIREVIYYYINGIWIEYEELLASDLSFSEKIERVIFGKAGIANEIHEEFYEAFMEEYTSEGNDILTFYQETALPSFLKLFAEGKEEGFIDKSLSDEAIMFYLQMFADYIRREDISREALPITEDLTKLFFYGISGKRSK